MNESGVLLHISSLPGEEPIGTLGENAYNFIDFLRLSKQKYWQILPIGPTSYGDSPYQATSAFAMNPYLIDLRMLVNDGLLTEKEISPGLLKTSKVDYGFLFINKLGILFKAYKRRTILLNEFKLFKKQNRYWLNNYSTYEFYRVKNNYKKFTEWDNRIKKNYKQVDKISFVQFLFYRQWMSLKQYANKNKIKIIGDMPIYCAYDSCDVWANPNDFLLDKNYNPICVAGCPPDFFSSDGQLWGNPIYNYEEMKSNNYRWWMNRIRHSLDLFDIVRIDHFRGFAGYYSIPYGEKTAKNGKWNVGPGYDLFRYVNKEFGIKRIIAENLGFLDQSVFNLLKKCKYPGMNIFQFEFGDFINNIPFMHDYPYNNIFYSGTHDNQTLMSFYRELGHNKKVVDSLCNIKEDDKPNLKMIEACFKKNCKITIIPLQDYLGLTDDIGRMNTPSKSYGNWVYRFDKNDLTQDLVTEMLKVKS